MTLHSLPLALTPLLCFAKRTSVVSPEIGSINFRFLFCFVLFEASRIPAVGISSLSLSETIIRTSLVLNYRRLLLSVRPVPREQPDDSKDGQGIESERGLGHKLIQSFILSPADEGWPLPSGCCVAARRLAATIRAASSR